MITDIIKGGLTRPINVKVFTLFDKHLRSISICTTNICYCNTLTLNSIKLFDM